MAPRPIPPLFILLWQRNLLVWRELAALVIYLSGIDLLMPRAGPTVGGGDPADGGFVQAGESALRAVGAAADLCDKAVPRVPAGYAVVAFWVALMLTRRQLLKLSAYRPAPAG